MNECSTKLFNFFFSFPTVKQFKSCHFHTHSFTIPSVIPTSNCATTCQISIFCNREINMAFDNKVNLFLLLFCIVFVRSLAVNKGKYKFFISIILKFTFTSAKTKNGAKIPPDCDCVYKQKKNCV